MEHELDDSLCQNNPIRADNYNFVKITFNGLKDHKTFEQFIRYFEFVTSNIQDAATKIKLFIECLREDALLFALDNCLQITVFGEIVEKYHTLYDIKHYSLNDFNKITLENAESLETYYTQKTKIGQILELSTTLVLQGLHAGMPLYVRRIMSMLPLQTSDEWLNIARNILKEKAEAIPFSPPQRGIQRLPHNSGNSAASTSMPRRESYPFYRGYPPPVNRMYYSETARSVVPYRIPPFPQHFRPAQRNPQRYPAITYPSNRPQHVYRENHQYGHQPPNQRSRNRAQE